MDSNTMDFVTVRDRPVAAPGLYNSCKHYYLIVVGWAPVQTRVILHSVSFFVAAAAAVEGDVLIL